MPKTGFKRDSGWKRWGKAIDPRVMRSKLRSNLRQATKLNGKLAEATIRETIKGGAFEANAPLTVMIKSSRKPLVDRGGLFTSITSTMMDDTTVFAGILRTDGDFNIALALHEGVTIPVTDKMRAMFFYLWQAAEGEIESDQLTGRAAELWERAPGGDWAPLDPGTTNIIIPGRPFIRMAFDNRRIRNLAKKNWQEAVRKTMQELARG